MICSNRPVQNSPSRWDPHALFQRLDVTDEADWRRVLDEAEAVYGPLAILVNNGAVRNDRNCRDKTPIRERGLIMAGIHRAARSTR
ncbi:hypothetical protein [Nocardia sp. NPDC019395]|uniref:hypothetical protein n=1 Tax=Nocardia sp. NPDC019395 TaxID=3154686 RepID=UPI003411D6C2